MENMENNDTNFFEKPRMLQERILRLREYANHLDEINGKEIFTPLIDIEVEEYEEYLTLENQRPNEELSYYKKTAFTFGGLFGLVFFAFVFYLSLEE